MHSYRTGIMVCLKGSKMFNVFVIKIFLLLVIYCIEFNILPTECTKLWLQLH